MKHLGIFLFGLIVLSSVFAQETQHPLRKVIESIYAAHAQADVEGALQHFGHPNFVLDNTHPPTPRSSALYGVWAGKEGFRQWLTTIGKAYEIHSFVHNIVSVDDKGALVHVLVDESCRSTGKRLAQPADVYHRYHFAGEQITRLDVYHPDALELAALCTSDVEAWLGANLPALVSGDAAAVVSPNVTVVVRGRADSPLVGEYNGTAFFQALAASDYSQPTFELVSSEDLKVTVEVNYSKWTVKPLDAGKRVWRNLKAFVVYQLEKVAVPVPAPAEPVATEQAAVTNDTAIETGAVEPAADAQVVAHDAEVQATVEPVQAVATEPQFTFQVASVEWMWASGDVTAYAAKKKHGKEHKHQEKEAEETATEQVEEEVEEVKEPKPKKDKGHKAEKENKAEKETKKEKEKEKGKKEKGSKKEEI